MNERENLWQPNQLFSIKFKSFKSLEVKFHQSENTKRSIQYRERENETTAGFVSTCAVFLHSAS